MKISLAYPKIPDGQNCPLKNCIAFEKYDGTNIHFVCTLYGDKKNGLCVLDDFGTRRDRFPLNNGGINKFVKAHPNLMGVTNQQLLEKRIYNLEHFIFTNYIGKADTVTIFTEFYGPNSFAGNHVPEDKKDLVIFDIMIGDVILPPKELISVFGKDFNVAKMIYKGKYSGQFVEDIRAGKYNVNEGVVCKGMVDGKVYMTKVKTNAYMKRLQEAFGDKWKEYWE